MLIFPIFATLIWACAMHWRRQWQSFAIVTSAVIVQLVLMRMLVAWHDQLPKMFGLFYELMWPYLALTGAMGYYICCLPRPHSGPLHCRTCGYHLVGLDPKGLNCPECGEEWRGAGSGLEDKPEDLIPIPKHPIPKRGTL